MHICSNSNGTKSSSITSSKHWTAVTNYVQVELCLKSNAAKFYHNIASKPARFKAVARACIHNAIDANPNHNNSESLLMGNFLVPQSTNKHNENGTEKVCLSVLRIKRIPSSQTKVVSCLLLISTALNN